MIRNFQSKPAAAPAENNDVQKGSVRPPRRAFGDITNGGGNNNEEVRGDAKPPTFQNGGGAPHHHVMMQATDMHPRPYMDRPIDDIDCKDTHNPLLASSYVNLMYKVFGDQETQYQVKCDYLSNNTLINEKMRCILVDWLVEVHLKFKLVPETLYLTIAIIDRYLEVSQVRRSRLQLVGVAALLVAAKYEEIYPPEFKDLIYITDKAYNKQDILEMESEIVTTLKYDFTLPTIHSFLCRYLKAAHADRAMVQLACYLAERSLQEYSMLRFLPSVIAASAVMVSRKSLSRHPWSPTLLKYTNYDECDLEACVMEMERLVNDPNCQQLAVKRKYSTPKFGSVSSLSLTF